jgi:serine/threonine-protein kinase
VSAQRFEQVRAIVDDVLDTAREERGARLARLCGDDLALHRDVRALLAADERCTDGFLAAPPAGELEDVCEEMEAREWVGRRVGAYRIVDLLAVGGMGSVFRAERIDGQYDHMAAIKVINGGVESARMRRRFHNERQALATLEHPNIARLLDGGATEDGRPYLIMELVEGEAIDRSCDRRRLDVRARLGVMRTVCEAVHFAHQKLIVHRDLKPANILVTTDGRPKLVDFGIARLIDTASPLPVAATATRTGAMTPQYSSPEQIRGETTSTGTDVYSLGVILYELLTGHRPYESSSSVRYELERHICEVDPVRPSATVEGTGSDVDEAAFAHEVAARRGETPRSLRQRLRGDLDVIILTAMEKDPARRYGSVRELSDDLRRYLDGLPVAACRGALRYRTGKFIRRNRGPVAAVLAVVMTLVVGLTGTSLGLLRARAERTSALEAKASAEAVTAFLGDLLADANPYRHGENVTILEMLADVSARIETELAGRPEVEAGVRHAVGRTYLNM